MEPIEKQRIEYAVSFALESALREIDDILNKHQIVVRKVDMNELAAQFTKVLESKI